MSHKLMLIDISRGYFNISYHVDRRAVVEHLLYNAGMEQEEWKAAEHLEWLAEVYKEAVKSIRQDYELDWHWPFLLRESKVPIERDKYYIFDDIGGLVLQHAYDTKEDARNAYKADTADDPDAIELSEDANELGVGPVLLLGYDYIVNLIPSGIDTPLSDFGVWFTPTMEATDVDD